MPRGAKVYLDDIQEAIQKIEEYTKDYDNEKFTKDPKTVDAVIRNFSVIGEAASHIPKEVQKQYSEIPWREVVGMRNKVIHEYFGITKDILWKTIQEDLPKLKQALQKMFNNIDY